MSTPIDVRAELAAALRRQVRDAHEWPMRDRRRFRNLLLDAASSDAMPLAELLLSVHDDELLGVFPESRSNRVAWENATARLTGDLQAQRFLETGVARFVAEAWASALGPEVVPAPRTAISRPAFVPRAPLRTASAAPARAATSRGTSSGATAASMRAYRRSNMMILLMGAVFTVLTILAFRSTNQRGAPPQPTAPVLLPADMPATVTTTPSPPRPPIAAAGANVPRDSSAGAPRSVRAAVPVAPASARTTDDIVLNAGRVLEGKVLSVRQQSIVVKDEDTGLDFEIAKADIDRIVTRDGRTMRFGDDNVPLLGDVEALKAVSHAGRYRVRWAERWGVQRGECAAVAHTFAPGIAIVVQHLRGAPMLRLAFVDGQGFNAAVRGDGLFESNADVAPARGPRGAFITTRLSGRFTHGGDLRGVARISAIQPDGTIVCDFALTMHGSREP